MGDYDKQLAYIAVAFIFILLLYYISIQLKKKNICPKQLSRCSTRIGVYSDICSNDISFSELPLNMLHIKTAYNCCCRGNYRNDYVDVVNGDENDYCALKNCALNGVRALDFTIFSINGKAVISASTTNEISYKELYNSVDFNNTMVKVNDFFLNNQNLSFTEDPLFLILRIQSDLPGIYESVNNSLNQAFGTGNANGNLIYSNQINGHTKINQFKIKKVVIIVQPANPSVYNLSSLSSTASYQVYADGYTIPHIYRYSDNVTNNTNSEIIVVLPDMHVSTSYNLDPTQTFTKGATFIGMNYQTQDKNLKKYNDRFIQRSIISQI